MTSGLTQKCMCLSMLHSFGGFFTNTMPCCRENAKRYTILSLSNQKSVPNVHHHDPLPVPNSKRDAMRTVDGRNPAPVIIRYHKLIWRTSHFLRKDFIGSRWWSSDFSPSTVGTYKMASPNLLSAHVARLIIRGLRLLRLVRALRMISYFKARQSAYRWMMMMMMMMTISIIESIY